MKNGEKASGKREQAADRMEILLKSALPRVADEPEPDRDLWPAMLRRMERESVPGAGKVPWFDWALAGGLVAFAAIVPRTIPVILYYL